MSRTIEVKILGDASQLQRSFQKASTSTKAFDRDLTRSARGAVTAAVSFRGLGRSVGFASGYFLGGAGLVYGLKSAIEKAETLEKAQRSLAVTIRKTGGNVAETLSGIERWAKAQASVGVTAVDAERGLARASAITGSAAKGQRAYTEALLVSKATGRQFNNVLIAAAKANNGQTTALARYIGKIKTGTTAQKLYNDVVARYKGQAEANTTASEKLSAALGNIETTVGSALLPTINRYADALTKWLGKSKNQERIQHDVNRVIHDASRVFKEMEGAIHRTSNAVGGFKHLVEILIGLKVASVLYRWAAAFRAVAFSAGASGAAGAVGRLLVAVRRVAQIGVVSLAFRFPGLAAGLAAIMSIPAAAAAAAAAVVAAVVASSGSAPNVKSSPKTNRVDAVKQLGSEGKLPQSVIMQALSKSGLSKNTYLGNALNNPTFVSVLYQWAKAHGLIGTAAGGAGPEAAAKAAAGRARSAPGAVAAVTKKVPTTSRGITLQGQLNLADLAVAKASTTKGTADDIAALRKRAAILRALIAKGGTLPEQTQRNQDLGGTLDQITSILDTGSKHNKKKAGAAKKAWAEYLKSLKNRVAEAGLTKGVGDDIAALNAEIAAIKAREAKHGKTPELEQARIAAEKQLKAANKKKPVLTFTEPFRLLLAEAKAGATKTTADDLKAEKALRSWTQKMIKSQKLRGQALIDAWNEVARLNDSIAQMSNQTSQHVVATSSRLLTANLGLNHAQRVALEGRYAQALAHGGVTPSGVGALGMAVTINVNGSGDPERVAKKVSEHLTKHAKRNSGQTRGTRGGSYLGHH